VRVDDEKYGGMISNRRCSEHLNTRLCQHKSLDLEATLLNGNRMLDNQTINRLSDKIGQLLPSGLQQAKSDFETQIKMLLQQQLAQLDFVSREEFDIQSRVLQRTRSKLEVLEQKLDQLEKTLVNP
jgi:BMFP domain-containing protein YqiC